MSSWDRAFHAYGPARGGDELLNVLRHGTEDAYLQEHPGVVWWRQPYSFLWSALYCGGRTTPATLLGLRHLVKTVTADDFGGADPRLRWAAAWWIRDVVRTAVTDTDLDDARLTAARHDEPAVNEWLNDYLRHERSIFDWDANDAPGDVLTAAARVDCFDFLPECFAPLSSLITPQQPEELRAAAASAIAMLVVHPDLRRHQEQITAYHADQACQGSPRYRASMLLGLGELGAATKKWLTDPELGVRVCAGLAPGLADDEAATAVLRAASLDPAALDRTFDGTPLHQLPAINHAVAEALCNRSAGFDLLLESAIAAVVSDVTGGDGVLSEPYLRKAYPQGLPLNGTHPQRILASVVANHNKAWRHDSRWTVTLARTKLPLDRQAWLASAG